MAYIYDIADTWNASGTTFTGIKLNVTNTASAFESNLIDLQVGGTTQFRVRSNGDIFNREITSSVAVRCAVGWFAGQSGNMNIAGTTGSINFTPTNNAGSALDLTILRDAANTLGQRNGVNAQAFNLYNTYTDASNYERGFMRFVSNVLTIGAEAAGTGTARTLRFFNTATTQLNMTIDPAGATVGLTREGLNYIRATNVVSGALALGTSISGGRVDSIVVTGTAVEIREDIVLMANLPTSNPAVAGQLWNNAGTLAIS